MIPDLTHTTFVGAGAETKQFGYEAIVNEGRRKRSKRVIQSEDRTLNRKGRDDLTSSTRDIVRNFAIATWVVRKHLDYTTAFNFQARTGVDEVDVQLERLLATRSRRGWIDTSRRHSLRRLIRIMEGRRIIDGDVGVNRVGSGFVRGSIQVIEEDRIRDPDDAGPEWTNGVKLNGLNQAVAFGVWKRTAKGLEFDREVPARQFYLHGYWDHTQRVDQVRGVTPLSAAINEVRDVKEGFDLSMMKLKVAQMFGLKIKRQVDGLGAYGQTRVEDSEDGEEDSDDKYEVDLSKGPFQLDLDPGDDADFLNVATPSEESVEFLKLVIFVALKALDIPISFFDESQTNFFGSRGALLHYLRSCESKIGDIQELLEWITNWLVDLWIMDGELMLPSQMGIEEVKWEWVPVGVPWWDPSKEVAGSIAAIGAALDNPQRICRAAGTDFFENVDAISEAVTYAKSKGVKLSYDLDEPNPDPEPTGDDEDARKSEEV